VAGTPPGSRPLCCPIRLSLRSLCLGGLVEAINEEVPRGVEALGSLDPILGERYRPALLNALLAKRRHSPRLKVRGDDPIQLFSHLWDRAVRAR